MSEPSDAASTIDLHQTSIGQGKLLNAAALLSMSSLASRLLSLVTTSVLARILVPADYGVVALGTTVVGLLDVLTNIQVSNTLIRSEQIVDEQLRSAFTINFLRGLASALVLLLFAHPIALMLGEPRLTPLLRVLSVVPFLNGLQNPVFVIFERHSQFLPDITRTLAANLAGTCTAIVCALMFHSFWALIASTVVIVSVHLLMTYWRVPIRIGFSFRDFSEMFNFGGWLALASIVEYGNAKVDIVLIGRNLGSSLLGGYQAGQQIMTMATGDVVGPMVRAIFPSLARCIDRDELRRKYLRIQSVIIGVALPIGIGLSALAPLVVRVFLGTQWASAIPVIQFLAPLSALQTMLATVDSVAMVQGKTRRLFHRTMTVFVVRLALLIGGFMLGGYMGVIYARVISGIFYVLYGLRLAATLTDTPMWLPVTNSWRSFCAAATLYLVITAWLPVHFDTAAHGSLLLVDLLLRIGAGAAVYLLVHVAIWLISRRPDGVERIIFEQARSILSGRRPQVA